MSLGNRDCIRDCDLRFLKCAYCGFESVFALNGLAAAILLGRDANCAADSDHGGHGNGYDLGAKHESGLLECRPARCAPLHAIWEPGVWRAVARTIQIANQDRPEATSCASSQSVIRVSVMGHHVAKSADSATSSRPQ